MLKAVNVMEQTDAVEDSIHWIEEEPHWLSSAWGDGSYIAAIATSAVCRNDMM